MNWTPLPETRQSLLARLHDPKDFEAWDEFIGIYEKSLWRYCRFRGLQSEEALEVAQQVWMIVFQKVGEWCNSNRLSPFRAWLFETARRVCLKTLRDRLKWKTFNASNHSLIQDQENDCESKTDEETKWQQWAFTWAASLVEAEVSSSTWQAFVQTTLENQPPSQVARELQMQLGTVYAAKCRGDWSSDVCSSDLKCRVMARIRTHIRELTQFSSNRG